jgi:hypothetical protein
MYIHKMNFGEKILEFAFRRSSDKIPSRDPLRVVVLCGHFFEIDEPG